MCPLSPQDLLHRCHHPYGRIWGILSFEMARRRSPKRLYSIRHSPIHGRGVFALRRIPKGTRVIEYWGERMSNEEADRRYAEANQGAFTLLFDLDGSTSSTRASVAILPAISTSPARRTARR